MALEDKIIPIPEPEKGQWALQQDTARLTELPGTGNTLRGGMVGGVAFNSTCPPTIITVTIQFLLLTIINGKSVRKYLYFSFST
jgi:hypothetical protein